MLSSWLGTNCCLFGRVGGFATGILSETGLTSDDKFGYLTVWLDLGVMPFIWANQK